MNTPDKTTYIPSQVDLLKLQIELEESNYKYALELQKDSASLIRMKDHIRELKDSLHMLQVKDLQQSENNYVVWR